MSISPQAIGRRIASCRSSGNLTLTETAARARISEALLSSLEQGAVSPVDFVTLEAVARALEVPMSRLVNDIALPGHATEPEESNDTLRTKLLDSFPKELRRALEDQKTAGKADPPMPVLVSLGKIAEGPDAPADSKEWDLAIRAFEKALQSDY